MHKSSCADARRLVHICLDAAGCETDRSRVAMHLMECPECARRFEFEATLRRTIRENLCVGGCPPHLRKTIASICAARRTAQIAPSL